MDANESCRPTLAIAYGLTSSRTASAISSAFNPPDRRRNRNPPAAVRVHQCRAQHGRRGSRDRHKQQHQRDGHNRSPPFAEQQRAEPDEKADVQSGNGHQVAQTRNAERGLVGVAQILLPPTSSPVSSPASRSGRARCTAFRQNRAILCGAKRRLSRLESKTSNCTALCSSSVAYAPAI